MVRCESRPSTIGPITLDTKQTGAPSAGNPHAGCDVAGAGNGFTVWLLRHSQRKRGATARLNLRNTAPVLDPTSLCVFRVLQEALQNATKHSGSKHFQVSLSAESNEICLTVQDSGSGFDPAEAIKGRGLGLTGMKERLKLVNGDLSIDSNRQAGATIHARVPLSPPAQTA